MIEKITHTNLNLDYGIFLLFDECNFYDLIQFEQNIKLKHGNFKYYSSYFILGNCCLTNISLFTVYILPSDPFGLFELFRRSIFFH